MKSKKAFSRLKESKKDPLEGNTPLDESNFRAWPKKMIDTYTKKNMLVDAMLWSRIINYYEEALKRSSDG